MEYCRLTGVELTEGQGCPLKKMCLNCVDMVINADGSYSCKNEAVMQKGKEKILAAVPAGFEIESLTLKPMALKDPTKKCGNYSPDMDGIVERIQGFFSEK